MADSIGTPGVLSALEHRLDQAAMLALLGPTALDVRTGVMAGPGSTALITGTSATGTMTVNVAAHHWVTTRGTADGIYVGTKEASTTVAIAAAPASNSRIDVVFSKQLDATSTITPDGSTAEQYGVVTGTAAASPVKPPLPVGALELGTVTVAAGATNTLGVGVTIANTARQTVARGGVIPVRSKAERDTISAHAGQPVFRQDLKVMEILAASGGGALAAIFGPAVIIRTPGSAGTNITNSIAGLHGGVVVNQPFGAGVPFQGFIVAAAYVLIQGSSEGWLSVTGDPASSPNTRKTNTSGIAEGSSLLTFNSFDSGASDSFTFQPILKGVGTITPYADANVSYSIVVAIPKAL